MDYEKSSQYSLFLLDKRDNFAKHLVRVGSKLLKEGKFNRDAFGETFFPDKEEIIKKIEATVKDKSQQGHSASARATAATNHKGDKRDIPETCFDSQLIDILRPHIDVCAKDLKDVVRSSDCCDDDGNESESNNESMSTVIECDSSGGKKKKKPNDKTANTDKMDSDDDGDSHYCVTQELMPGECSKIFIHKSGVDIIRSKMDEKMIDFENDLLETLYIYRR